MKKLLPLTLVLSLSTCSGMNVIGQMMVDAGELLTDAGNGNAQPATPQKGLTAATDVAQLDSGSTIINGAAVEVLTGPFFLTHVSEGQLANEIYLWVATTTCAMPAGERFRASGGEGYFVKAGQKLCASGSAFGGGATSVTWAGWRPY